VILVYRENKERLIEILRNIDNILRDVLKRISDALETLA